MRNPGELASAFRGRGLRVTPQRQRIFEFLADNHLHPTVEAVYDAVVTEMPTLSLKTVYQTVHDLAAMGELALLDVGLGSLRIDTNVEHVHHHLICRVCGKVRDVEVDFGHLQLTQHQRQGFEVGGAEVVFRGRCGDCARTRRVRRSVSDGSTTR